VAHFEKAEYFEHPQRVAHRTATDAEAPGEEPFGGKSAARLKRGVEDQTANPIRDLFWNARLFDGFE
jgi:hypothetical protein